MTAYDFYKKAIQFDWYDNHNAAQWLTKYAFETYDIVLDEELANKMVRISFFNNNDEEIKKELDSINLQ